MPAPPGMMNAAGHLSLFTGSLLASTILPGGVEVLLYAMLESGAYASLPLLATATIGNTIGGLVTFCLGALLHRALGAARYGRQLKKYFRLQPAALARVRRWGAPCLLFSWMPLLGDPLCLAAGYLRLAFWPSALMIFTGKFLRYLALLWLLGWR